MTEELRKTIQRCGYDPNTVNTSSPFAWIEARADADKARGYLSESSWLLFEALNELSKVVPPSISKLTPKNIQDIQKILDKHRGTLQTLRVKLDTAKHFIDLACPYIPNEGPEGANENGPERAD